ncbi:SpaA isopeptide-forming pilin-related protein [Prauserella oleivorans]|uniref:SpaA isopeptide-forming pilin-related protein n=1 Tax=Prauserella oleivorans TaxID=1478153 RepID=A0ABW5W4Y4_9PSEU
MSMRHRSGPARTGRRGAARLLAVVAVACLALTTPMPATVAQQESEPATVRVYVGDVRSGPDTIGPLAGARFGLFATNPGVSLDSHDGFTDATPMYSCTSGADGWCTFTVPVDESLPDSGRLWLAATGSAGGEYANPQWQTGPLSPNNRDPLYSLRHVFQTPVLQAGQTYDSYGPNRNWITDPGLETTPPTAVPGTQNYSRRVASGGVFPLSRPNPDLATQCGLRIALVVDLSSSVAPYVEDLKDALDDFVTALRGTPSQAALFTFGTDSPANGYGANTSLLPVATNGDNKTFRDLYAGWETPPTNWTNWDRGLAAVADANTAAGGQQFDMAVVVTDGNPTVYGPEPTHTVNGREETKDPNSGYTRFRELGNAVASANLVKSQGTRIMAVGVGNGVSGDASYNLRAISGRDAYDGTNLDEADYLQQADYADAGEALRRLVLGSCAPSVSVIKQIVPHGDLDDGTIDAPYTPTDPWTFTATPTGDATVTPTTATTDPQTGALNFDMAFDTGPQGLHIAETPQEGYTALPEHTTCVNKTSGDDEPVTPDPDPENPGAFTVDVGLEDAISCTVYNQAPDFDQASVTVNKRWKVTTVTGPDGETTTAEYEHGKQPTGLEASLELDGPGGAESSSQPWGQPRDGYDAVDDGSVGVTEDVTITPPGCELTGADIDGTDLTPGTATEMDLRPGANEWTITNEVECRSHLTLRKEIGAGGQADPQWWTLQAHGPDDALPGPTGRVETAPTLVTPEVIYQLAEVADEPGGDVPHDVLHYAQNDQRTRPLHFPLSTGSWGCHVVGEDSGGAFSTDIEGAIAVPLGQDVVCTAVNQTAWLDVVKQVEGGDAKPGDFTLRVSPVGPAPPGAHEHDIAGAPEPGNQLTVRPRQDYAISEVSGPDGYRLTGITCTAGERELDPERFALEFGGTATCVATNRRLSELAVEKRDAADRSVLPGAGFDLYSDTDGDGDGGAGLTDDAPDPDDTLIDSCTTGEDGRCSIGELDFVSYYWFENTAPEGYRLPADRTSDIITIDENNAGDPHTTTFTDSKEPSPPPTEPTEPEPTTPTEPTGPGVPDGPDEPGHPGAPDGPDQPDGGDGDQGTLPGTGADIGVPLALGIVFLLAGATVLALVRRARS